MVMEARKVSREVFIRVAARRDWEGGRASRVAFGLADAGSHGVEVLVCVDLRDTRWDKGLRGAR